MAMILSLIVYRQVILSWTYLFDSESAVIIEQFSHQIYMIFCGTLGKPVTEMILKNQTSAWNQIDRFFMILSYNLGLSNEILLVLFAIVCSAFSYARYQSQ